MVCFPRQFCFIEPLWCLRKLLKKILMDPEVFSSFSICDSKDIQRAEFLKLLLSTLEEKLLFRATFRHKLTSINSPAQHSKFSNWILVRIRP